MESFGEVDWDISALLEKHSNIQAFCCCFLIGKLIYNMVLVLSIQQSDAK